MASETSTYTHQELMALVLPAMGLDPERVAGVIAVAQLKDGRICMLSPQAVSELSVIGTLAHAIDQLAASLQGDL
jgi:hypothetical protein